MSSLDRLPESNEGYGTKEYWDKRYTQELDGFSFDWFKSYKDICHIIREIIPDKTSRILMLGCGNSTLSEDMWEDGYKNIVNVDYSSVVIQQMRARHELARPEMEWREMDVRALDFDSDSFDVAIDKGTMDAMMTSKGDVWDPPEDVVQNCNQEVSEVLRVLHKPEGAFIYLTFGQPHFRRRYLTRENTSLEVRQLGEAFHYFLYILKTAARDTSQFKDVGRQPVPYHAKLFAHIHQCALSDEVRLTTGLGQGRDWSKYMAT